MRSIAKYYALAGKAWGRELLNGAELWLDAADVSGQTLPNSGTGGSALDATLGSSSAAEPTTNDPMVLAHDGTNYLYLPGVNGNYASTPDAAALDITGDIDIRCRVSLSEFSTAQALVSKAQTSAGGYELAVSGGFMRFIWATGTTTITRFSVNTLTAAGLTAGETYWLRATLDVDNGAGGAQVSFFWASDSVTEPTSWTAFTQPAAEGTTTVIGNATQQLGIGAYFNGGATPLAGKLFRAIVRNGIDGITVFDADFTTGITAGSQTSFTESSANAATVTINRSTSGRKAVAVVRPTMLFGTDDYCFVADNDLFDFATGNTGTVVLVRRSWGTPTNQPLLAKRTTTGGTAGSVGWSMRTGVSSGYVAIMERDDGATVAAAIGPTGSAGALAVTTSTFDGSNMVTYLGTAPGVSAAYSGSIANAVQFRIGSTSTGSGFADMEFYGAAVFRRALSAAEIEAITDYFEAA